MQLPDFQDYPQTLAEAKKTGARYYFTGCPCPRGHVELRTAHRGECRRCHAEYASRWLREHGQPGNAEAVRLYRWKVECKIASFHGRPMPDPPKLKKRA